MTDRDIAKLFQKFQDDPTMRGEFDVARSCQAIADRLGYETDGKPASYSVRDHLEFYLWDFSHVLLRPMAASLAVFVFAIMGWVSVANASMHSLPGDKLYSVKLSVEKAQLALAFSADAQANLKVEFASRRLEEMVEVAADKHQSAPESVELAVERFKSEVTTIKEELQEAGASVEQQKELAKAVGRKAESYSSAVAATTTELSPEVRTQVEEIIEETKEQAVEVIITAHEAQQDAETERELALALETELEAITVEYGEAADSTIETVNALQATGNYRRAFQVIKEFKLQ